MSAITYACLVMALPDLTLLPVLELWDAAGRSARLNTRKPCAQKDEVLGALAKPSPNAAYRQSNLFPLSLPLSMTAVMHSSITYSCLIMALPDLTLPPVLELREAGVPSV